MLDLERQDIKFLPGVGPQRARLLNDELKIYTLNDLLYYFPYKHIDRSRLYAIKELTADMPYVQIKGRFSVTKPRAKDESAAWWLILRMVMEWWTWSGFRESSISLLIIKCIRSISCLEDLRPLTGASISRIPI